MSDIKPILLYSHAKGPNGWKVAIIFEELGLPYKTKFLESDEMKKEPYESINPNGRIPAIEDPNTGVTVFESGAIIEYLIETYDKSVSLHYDSTAEYWAAKSWLHFQMSGQGPYFGQKVWFTHYHPEKIQSAIDRYSKEIERVTSVIDRHLKKKGTPYLVGDKVTYADLSFVTWYNAVAFLFPEFDYKNEYPTFANWFESLLNRPSVQKIGREKAAAAEQK